MQEDTKSEFGGLGVVVGVLVGAGVGLAAGGVGLGGMTGVAVAGTGVGVAIGSTTPPPCWMAEVTRALMETPSLLRFM